MAITYTVQGTIKDDLTYQARCSQAAQKAAMDVIGEAQGGSSAEDWATRQEFGHRVLAGNAQRLFWGPVLANIGAGASTATDESGISDGELDTSVSAVWNDLAGIVAA